MKGGGGESCVESGDGSGLDGGPSISLDLHEVSYT